MFTKNVSYDELFISRGTLFPSKEMYKKPPPNLQFHTLELEWCKEFKEILLEWMTHQGRNSDIWHDCKPSLLQATRCGLLAEVQELTTMHDLFLGLRTEGFSYSTTGNCMGSQDPNRKTCITQLLAGQVSSTCSGSGAARRRRRRKRATSKCRCLGERKKGGERGTDRHRRKTNTQMHIYTPEREQEREQERESK